MKKENRKEVEEGSTLSPNSIMSFIPVVTTDSKTGVLLMHAFMNKEALRLTIETKRRITIVEAENVFGIKVLLAVLFKKWIRYLSMMIKIVFGLKLQLLEMQVAM